jgi:hypothetical protein
LTLPDPLCSAPHDDGRSIGADATDVTTNPMNNNNNITTDPMNESRVEGQAKDTGLEEVSVDDSTPTTSVTQSLLKSGLIHINKITLTVINKLVMTSHQNKDQCSAVSCFS